MANFKTNRSFLKMFFLGLITFGIYPLVAYANITNDVNIICTPHDGKKSMNYYLLVLLMTGITLGIAPIVWNHRICNRMGAELKRRGINYSISAGTFWGWGVFGTLLAGIGPIVYAVKFIKASNKLNADYNVNG